MSACEQDGGRVSVGREQGLIGHGLGNGLDLTGEALQGLTNVLHIRYVRWRGYKWVCGCMHRLIARDGGVTPEEVTVKGGWQH